MRYLLLISTFAASLAAQPTPPPRSVRVPAVTCPDATKLSFLVFVPGSGFQCVTAPVIHAFKNHEKEK